MPKFYFHIYNSEEIRDPEGAELPTLAAAKMEATKAARELMAEDLTTTGEITLSHRIDVDFEDGSQAFVLPFRACVEIHC